jgi:hypothetical protein
MDVKIFMSAAYAGQLKMKTEIMRLVSRGKSSRGLEQSKTLRAVPISSCRAKRLGLR